MRVDRNNIYRLNTKMLISINNKINNNCSYYRTLFRERLTIISLDIFIPKSPWVSVVGVWQMRITNDIVGLKYTKLCISIYIETYPMARVFFVGSRSAREIWQTSRQDWGTLSQLVYCFFLVNKTLGFGVVTPRRSFRGCLVFRISRIG